jgi:hypothetical protein
MLDVLLNRFESTDETRALVQGNFELVHLGGMTIARATDEPGWKWSSHAGPRVGARRCSAEHVGLVPRGVATAALDNGNIVGPRESGAFSIPPISHNGRVVGNQPCVPLHRVGADK